MTEKGIFGRLKSRFAPTEGQTAISLREPYHLGRGRVRVIHHRAPIRVNLLRAGTELLVCPELPLQGPPIEEQTSFLLTTPDQCLKGINGFLRLEKPGDSIVIGKHDRLQTAIFNYRETMDLRRLSITHDGDALVFKALVSDAEIELSPVSRADTIEKVKGWRLEKLHRIRKFFGGPVQPLAAEEALDSLRAVNAILETEVYRQLDDRGTPGGVLRLPGELTPVIVGDLHAQVDNLLTLLSHNGFLEALENGDAALIILGDAVHSEMDGQLDEMEDSLLMMDLILRLKQRFPQRLFYVRGNHDSFSDSVFKFGVAQCLMWESTLRGRRGEAYLAEMRRFYQRLPYLVLTEDFVACHAAPVKTRFTLDMLINIYRHPGLVRELTHNRIRRRNLPAGYTRGDVKHFRDGLGIAESTPFFVSHSPLDREHPWWLEAGGIKNHHIVFSANVPWIGVFTRVRGRMIPLSYRQENLLSFVNGNGNQ
ncbi:MAG: metallophosphoesterase [Pseudomonadota bacterium]|nr:metallophosphoesterase [Pseudomonadota bacterium]